MTPLPDQARISVLVEVEPAFAFQIFTEEIDRWWRRGLRYRALRSSSGTIHLEPWVGGRLFEAVTDGGDTELRETGRVLLWEPPRRLTFEWRAMNFAPGERTEVDVEFEPARSGTRVTVTHRGWSHIRPDHPVRHGLDPEAFVGDMGRWWGDLMTSLREHARDRGTASSQ